MKFIVIGISDHPEPFFQPEVLETIRNGRVFSGGRRHHDIVAPLLPKDAEWIDITVPLDAVFERYSSLFTLHFSGEADSSLFTLHSSGEADSSLFTLHFSLPIIVFASGDPLFFGFANTIRRKMPDAEVVVYPTFNSLQMLAHRLVMPYHDMRIVSLTGRPWPEFDRALIERAPKIGILTDREHTPATIAQRMLDYGYTYYNMHVGEHLGNPAEEKVTTLTLDEAVHRQFTTPNCVIAEANSCVPSVASDQRSSASLSSTAAANSSLFTLHSSLSTLHSSGEADSSLFTLHSSLKYGLPDSAFTLLDGREKMITKMPIRLLTLQALDLPRRHVFWDIGFCTGSVSIEARLLFPHLEIHSFEIRPECEAIIRDNARRFGAPGIHVHIGDFLTTPLPHREGQGVGLPDAVFIGGHGGRLKEIMAKVLTVLAPDGVIVMNSVVAPKVTTDSHQLWDEACQELGLRQEPPTRIQLNDHHPITILKCKRR